ncbi:MAG: hypothetical protein LBQ51_01165 [Desulfovibrio sp.]|nr:hypothetical protein [Desulfovibrio sp.]
MEKSTGDAGKAVARLGTAYAAATKAAEKTAIAAALAKMVSEDLGGSIFMSNAIHQYASNGGMWPGYGAMLSWTMVQEAIERWRMPVMEDIDIEHGLAALLETARLLIPKLDEAVDILKRRKPNLTAEQINVMVDVLSDAP